MSNPNSFFLDAETCVFNPLSPGDSDAGKKNHSKYMWNVSFSYNSCDLNKKSQGPQPCALLGPRCPSSTLKQLQHFIKFLLDANVLCPFQVRYWVGLTPEQAFLTS